MIRVLENTKVPKTRSAMEFQLEVPYDVSKVHFQVERHFLVLICRATNHTRYKYTNRYVAFYNSTERTDTSGRRGCWRGGILWGSLIWSTRRTGLVILLRNLRRIRAPPPNSDDDTMRILIATDNHLGYLEKDPVRGNDSFITFEEILQQAKKLQVCQNFNYLLYVLNK